MENDEGNVVTAKNRCLSQGDPVPPVGPLEEGPC